MIQTNVSKIHPRLYNIWVEEPFHDGVGADVCDGGEDQHLAWLLPHQVLATLAELGEGAVEESARSEPRVWCMECMMASLHSLTLTPVGGCCRLPLILYLDKFLGSQTY